MATIGSIVVAFGADLKGLSEGIETAISLFDRVSEKVDTLSRQLEGLSRSDVSINVSADVSEVEQATRGVEELSTAIESVASPEGISSGLSEVTDAAVSAAGSTRTATTFISRFGEVASEAMRRPADEAVRGSAAYAEMRDSVIGMQSVVQQSLLAVSSSANATALAASGVSEAFSTLAQGGSAGEFADAAIVAAGRVNDAYQQVRLLFSETIPGAFQATRAAVVSFTGTIGGAGTVMAAYRGSSAATAIVVGSLAGSIASAGAAIATYSAIMAAARVAFSGLSEEARGYAEAGTSVAAMFVAGAAASRAGTAAYQLVASAMFRSGSASELFRRAVESLTQATSRLLSPALQAISVYTTLTSVLGVASAAMRGFSNSQQSVSQTFSEIAAAVGRFAVTSVAVGAVSGSLTALRTYATTAGASMTSAGAGSAVMAGAFRGAASAAGGLVAALPAVAVAVSVAAVASGRFSQELERLAGKAESIEQMADRFGSSLEQMEKIRTAAANANVSMMALVRSQQNFYSSLSKVKSGQFESQSVREAKIAFDELGIPVEKLKSLKPEEAFKLVAKSLSDVKNAADRTRIAVDLFGARGAFALPALKEIGELEEDFNRLGGAIRQVDFGNIMAMEKSFDRLNNAGAALGRTLLVPVVSLQRAFNNFSAELKGGLVAALAPLMTMLNDISKPIAVTIEAFGRMVNVTLRLIGIFTGIAAFFQIFASVAQIFEGIGEGFRAALSPLEGLIEMLSSAGAEAGIFSAILNGVAAVLNAVGVAIGFVIGAAANVAVVIAAGAAAWVIYTAAVALASATSITAAISFAAAWAAALAPIAAVIAVVAAIGAAVMVVVATVKALFSGFYLLGQAVGLIGKEREQIDATSASTKDFAAAAREAQDAASWFSDGESESKIAGSVDRARVAFNGLVTESLRYGKAGSDTITSVQKRYADLEQSLADGKISTAEFTKKTDDLFASANKGMKDYENSTAVTLSKNLDLYKRLDDAVRQAGKSVRDLSAGTVVDDTFFPATNEVKARASQYKAEYAAAIEAIKKKQQSGAFQVELNQRREQLSADLSAGKITQDQYTSLKMELDSTTAQEQASNAAEEVQREFDRKTAKLKADISFADDIRKKLDEAFLSPVEKFQKELAKVRDNPALSASEKESAEKMLRRDARESLVGKSAQQLLTERTRDITQAKDAGLVSDPESSAELKSAVAEFSSALGIAKTPFEEFSANLDNVTKQFGFAGEPLEDVRRKLSGNAEQLALFDRAVQEARENLLASLGVEKTPQQVFEEQMTKIDAAVNSTDPGKNITADQAAQARAAARRKRDSELGAGEDLGGQFRDRQRRIDEAFGGGRDPEKQRIASNKLAIDRREAAGLEATPAQALQAGIDKINDIFGEAGKGTAEYNEAMKKNRESVLASVGIEKSAAQVRKDAIDKLNGLKLSSEEAAQANRKISESFMSAIGVTKTPFEQFSSSMDNIAEQFGMAGQPIDAVREKLKGNAEDLALFDRAVKESRDNLLQSLGIEKTPQAIFEEQMQKIDEAVNSDDPNKRISEEQANQARAAATRKRNESLGAGADLSGQFEERRQKIAEAFGENGEKDPARFRVAQNQLAMDRRQAAGLDATPAQQMQAGVDKINDAFGVTGKTLDEVRASLSPEEFKEYQAAIKKNADAVKASLGVEKTGAEKLAETREKLAQAVDDNVITQEEANKAIKDQKDSLLSSLGISKSPAQEFEDAVEKIRENASELSSEEIAKGLKEAKDKMLSALGIDKTPTAAFEDTMAKLSDAAMRGDISLEEFAKGAQNAKDALLSSLGIPLDPAVQLGKRMDDLNEAVNSGAISTEEFARGQEAAKKEFLPGGEEESPVKKFKRDLESLENATASGLISPEEMAERKQRLQAQLQEDLKPAMNALAPDRRGVEGADARSKAGVDTFFRILRGNDNPSLKAQLEIARNTKVLAEAAGTPDAAPVIAQLSAR